MDLKTTFLRGDLEEDVYMAQPKGCVQPGREQLVCKLNKALYGLKQGARQWYQKFDTFMRSQEFKRSQEDYCLYTKKLSDGLQITLILYVDDMLIARKSKSEIANLKQILSSQFAMKDLGEANHFLGMRIKRNRKKGILELSQESYIKKVLQHFNMTKGKLVSTPLPSYTKLSKEDSPKSDFEKAEMAKVPYSLAMGSLMWAMIATRLDIAFALGVVSRYMANPGKKHWLAVKNIFRYLKRTANRCL